MIAAKPFLAEGKQEGKNMERTNKLWILDSTLRDGAQGENISFSVQDKLRIVSALDQLGIDYIEAGNPASNPKDLEFFERVRALPLRHARLAAFGSTRRKDERAEDSEGLRALLQANTPAVCIFGKSWDFHVTHILHTTLEENLRMIEQSVAFLSRQTAGRSSLTRSTFSTAMPGTPRTRWRRWTRHSGEERTVSACVRQTAAPSPIKWPR